MFSCIKIDWSYGEIRYVVFELPWSKIGGKVPYGVRQNAMLENILLPGLGLRELEIPFPTKTTNPTFNLNLCSHAEPL